jgi:hypothetical protein
METKFLNKQNAKHNRLNATSQMQRGMSSFGMTLEGSEGACHLPLGNQVWT